MVTDSLVRVTVPQNPRALRRREVCLIVNVHHFQLAEFAVFDFVKYAAAVVDAVDGDTAVALDLGGSLQHAAGSGIQTGQRAFAFGIHMLIGQFNTCFAEPFGQFIKCEHGIQIGAFVPFLFLGNAGTDKYHL